MIDPNVTLRGDRVMVTNAMSSFYGRCGEVTKIGTHWIDVMLDREGFSITFNPTELSRAGIPARDAVMLGDACDEYGAPKVEVPCVTCQRKCFLEDTKCWWCETPNPTQARKS